MDLCGRECRGILARIGEHKRGSFERVNDETLKRVRVEGVWRDRVVVHRSLVCKAVRV